MAEIVGVGRGSDVAEEMARKRPHFRALDGLRGVAVILVFLFHYAGGAQSPMPLLHWIGELNNAGWTGVQLFFVLSGFLITGILWDSYGDPHWWRNFYMRRTLRIFPLYFGALVLVAIGAAALGHLQQALQRIWIDVFFLQDMPVLVNQASDLGSPFPLYHFWSLAVEEQFYLIWPFLLAAQRTRRGAEILCAATVAGSIVFRLLLWHFVPAANLQFSAFLLTHAGELAAGGWLALCFRGPEWKTVVRFAPVACALGLFGFLACGIASGTLKSQGQYMMIWGLTSIALFYSALLVMALRPGIVATVFGAHWLRWVGGISYGIYVFHVLLRQFVHVLALWINRINGGGGRLREQGLEVVLGAIVSVAAAYLSFHWFERPFLTLKNRFASRPEISTR